MTDPNQEQALRALLSKATRKDLCGVGLDDDLVRKFGLDSLAGLRLLAAVEKHFKVRFPDQRLGEFRTLRHLLDLIAAEQQAGEPEEKHP